MLRSTLLTCQHNKNNPIGKTVIDIDNDRFIRNNSFLLMIFCNVKERNDIKTVTIGLTRINGG